MHLMQPLHFKTLTPIFKYKNILQASYTLKSSSKSHTIINIQMNHHVFSIIFVLLPFAHMANRKQSGLEN